MSSVEVLAPLRIETRFYPPDPLDDERNFWRLRLRVYPDEFSMAREQPPPTPEELDIWDDILRAYQGQDPGGEAHLHQLAARFGIERTIWLRRNVPIIQGAGADRTDRTFARARDPDAPPLTQKPYGLPPRIAVWFLEVGATEPTLKAILIPNRSEVAADLDLRKFKDAPGVADGDLPATWWTSFKRAEDVHLAIEFLWQVGELPPPLEAILVCGLGDVAPDALIANHAGDGRLAVLAQGTPTNTVDGEATVEMGGDPADWLQIDAEPPALGSASRLVIATLTGNRAEPVRLHGGDVDGAGFASVIVRALWPVLWGHSLRDSIGAARDEARLAEWAATYLAPEGPYPAIRIGQQPYGLLPATILADWIDDGDGTVDRLRGWLMTWRNAAAADAAKTPGTVVGGASRDFLELLGETTPTRRWGSRPIAPVPILQAYRVIMGLPPVVPSPWEAAAAASLGGLAGPLSPLAPYGTVKPLGPESREATDDPERLRALIDFATDGFPLRWQGTLGLLGHLMLDTLVLERARLGLAAETLDAGLPVDPESRLAIADGPERLIELAEFGFPIALASLEASPDPGAQVLAAQYNALVDALRRLVDVYEQNSEALTACLFAALDTASHRVDPWITGIADSRLRRMVEEQAPFFLGVYGWVDQPAPWAVDGPDGRLPPGPTKAGLLHAPSHAQALTAALLRDAAVRYPAETRWDITIDSEKIRAASRLAERVRLGVHPYEALGLEVERIVGDWDQVRMLRANYPLRSTHLGQRCCDGARVLRLLFRRQPADPPAPVLTAAIVEELKVYDSALDTYADLLIADGVHAQVSGQGKLAHAAMDAIAGLGAPPELRAIRTPRQAGTVRVSVWAMLPAAAAEANATLGVAADPAFAAHLDSELGAPSTWTWTVGGTSVSLRDRDLHGADAIALRPSELDRFLRGDADAAAAISSTGGAEKLALSMKLAELLGGGDDNPPIPDPRDGRDDAAADASDFRTAMLKDLAERVTSLTLRVDQLIAEADALLPGALYARLRPWKVAEATEAEALKQGLKALELRSTKAAAAAAARTDVNSLRLAIRNLVANPRLPILPVVDRTAVDRALDGRPMATVGLGADGRPATDPEWLEIVAAVRPRLALLEALQFDPRSAPWPAAVWTEDGSGKPWTTIGPVVVAYGPGIDGQDSKVALAALDAWTDSIPSDQHTTSAAFGFNGPKSRAPQAILLAVPPNPGQRLTEADLARLVLDIRQLARARACRPRIGERVATPSVLLSLPHVFLDHWR